MKGNQSGDEAEDLAEDQLALRKAYLDLTLDSQPSNPFLVLNFILSLHLSHQQHMLLYWPASLRPQYCLQAESMSIAGSGTLCQSCWREL